MNVQIICLRICSIMDCTLCKGLGVQSQEESRPTDLISLVKARWSETRSNSNEYTGVLAGISIISNKIWKDVVCFALLMGRNSTCLVTPCAWNACLAVVETVTLGVIRRRGLRWVGTWLYDVLTFSYWQYLYTKFSRVNLRPLAEYHLIAFCVVLYLVLSI